MLSNKADNIVKKLNKNFEGPFFIKTKISPTIYEIKNKKGKSLGNGNVKDNKKYIKKTKQTNRNTHRIVRWQNRYRDTCDKAS